MKELRLLPLVIVAVSALFLLKAMAFLAVEPPALGVSPAHAQAADEAAADPDAAAVPAEVEQEEEGPRGEDPTIARPGAAEALKESLAERRIELEARETDLDLREKLLAATSQRIEERITELEAIEQRIDTMLKQRDEAEQARFAGVVEMYAKMKPKDAARIFDGLEPDVLVRVAEAIQPRQMSQIMAEMDPKVAQRLTLEMSAQPVELTLQETAPGELPKIVGSPTN